MEKLLLIIALFFLPSIVIATRPLQNPLVVHGRVYCDTCRAGFETPASTYIAGAKVKIECKSRDSMQLRYTNYGVTDSTGTFKLTVTKDHDNQVCDVVLVSSPLSNCALTVPGDDRARAILTTHNGIASNTRFVNSLGFVREAPLAGCSKLLQTYNESD